MRAHVIEDGKIVNTIEIESLDKFPEMNLIDADLHNGGPGDSYDGTKVIKASPGPRPKTKEEKLLDKLVASGVITSEDADEIRNG